MNGNSESAEMLERRALLKRVAWMLGGAVSAPAALAILQGCSAKEAAPGAAAWQPKFFKGAQADLMTAIADVIIPKTDTSGALDAGVPAFIDLIMADAYPKDAQDRFSAGINEFDDRGRRRRQGVSRTGRGTTHRDGAAVDRSRAHGRA